jgi:hypothetical protein
MAEFHSEDCMRIFDICTRFNMKLMSKSEAQEELNACDLSNRENFKPYVQHDLEVIFEEEVVDEAVVSETATHSILDKKSHEVVKKEYK